ncbi:cytochrome P450 [Nonomuraea sp. NPDC049400]|uniref:cytochrome P450 n=1 Tax=Nonomuraea sp. NPDC049400 TaxID=3364352 RepID=UPI0037B6F8A0
MLDGRRAWIITRYADARAALTDRRLSNDLRRWPGGARSWPSEKAGGVHSHLLHNDPPVHSRMRRLVQKALMPRNVARLRTRTGEIAADLLDQMSAVQSDVIDLLPAFASQLPLTVLGELLGIPPEGRSMILAALAAYDDPGEANRVTRELAALFTDLLAAKRADPADDVLSTLASVRVDGEGGAGEGLTSAEILSLAFQLVMAGFDTTVNLIASGTLALLTNPGELARLRKAPALIPAAVEELLRFVNPVSHASDRFTLEDLPIGDVVIPAGEWVFIAISSGNRDPDRFPEPDLLDLGRDTTGHIAFGYGIHYCIGAPLARMEGEVAFAALLDRFPSLALAVPPDQLRWRRNSLMHGLAALPVRLR